MTLSQRLQRDLQQAIRDKDGNRKSAIRLVRAAILNEQIAKQRELADEDILEIIRKEIKQHRESLSEFEKGQRADLVTEEQEQLAVLLSYLPPQMSRSEIVGAAQQAIAEVQPSGPEQLGQVMRILMPRVRGKADGKTVNEVVKELLSTPSQGACNES
jgi:uncharacterized protein YqeY